MRAIVWAVVFVALAPQSLHAQEVGVPPEAVTEAVASPGTRSVRGPLVASAEMGSLGVISHRLQFGRDGTYFNLRSQGGQDNLYFNLKFALDLSLSARQRVIALYQPLEIVSEERLRRDLVTDEITFPAGTPMRFQYGFPFYRLSYLYDWIDNKSTRFSLGGSLQIRNATIHLASLDGTLARASRDVGPVPLVKVVWERRPSSRLWYGTEVDGIYAPISYFNGSDNEVRGALLDANIRVGRPFHETADIYLNLRYLGGGAVGTSDKTATRDGYVRNWLQFGILAVGFRFNP